MNQQGKQPLSPNLEKEFARFLERDFNQCFQHMRYYDGQIFEILKFMFIAYSGLIGVALSIYKIGLSRNIELDLPAIAIISVGLALGLCLFALIIRNRVYFVRVSRYINEQRGVFFQYKSLGFENKSGMYTDHKQPLYFNWRSSHSWFSYIVAALNATLLGVLLYLRLTSQYRTAGILIGTLLLLVIQLVLGICYLRSYEDEEKSGEKTKSAIKSSHQ